MIRIEALTLDELVERLRVFEDVILYQQDHPTKSIDLSESDNLRYDIWNEEIAGATIHAFRSIDDGQYETRWLCINVPADNPEFEGFDHAWLEYEL